LKNTNIKYLSKKYVIFISALVVFSDLAYADFLMRVKKIFQKVEFQELIFLLGFPSCAIGEGTTPVKMTIWI